eukprot:symbB.v1.2.015460.t1/scaffold1155.1/size134886/4
MKPTRPARSAKRSVISDETCRRCAGQTNLTVDGVCCQRVDGYGRPSSLNQPPVTPMKINGGKFLEQNLEIGWPELAQKYQAQIRPHHSDRHVTPRFLSPIRRHFLGRLSTADVLDRANNSLKDGPKES